MKKRIISILLALCLCMGLLAVTAGAETRVGLTLHTGSGSSTSIVAIGQEVTLPLPVRDGYIFDGWYGDEACTAGNGPMMKILIAGQTELWAKWVAEADADSAAKFTLNFETNGGNTITPIETTYGVTVDLSAYVPEKEDYIFTNWYADAACSERVTTVMMTENSTVYAGWLPLADAEAKYQQQADGPWVLDTFVKAFRNVYDGGTIKLLKNTEIDTPLMTDKTITITSDESAAAPYTLKRAAVFQPINTSEFLMSFVHKGDYGTPTFDADVTLYLENIIVDGGSEDGIVAHDALIQLGYANLVLGEGASLQNNNDAGGRAGAVSSFGGNVTVGKGSQIVNNEACLGAGIFADGGTVKITGGKIEGNTATTDSRGNFTVRINEQKCGAGIFMWSRDDLPDTVVELESGSISNNIAGNYGGGVYVKANTGKTATFRMSGGSVKGNEARYGGGVYILSSALEMSGGEITGNTAVRNGGGVYYAPLDEHLVYLSGSPKITGNTGNGVEHNICMEYMNPTPDSTRTIILTGALEDGAEIGVTRLLKPTDAEPAKLVAEPSAAAGYTITESDREKFFSDDPAYTIRLQNGNLVMTAAIRVGGLTVSPKEVTMEVGGKSQLTATVTPEDASNKTVRWTSSDETIATVDANGVVTAKAVGTVTITATTVDGQYTASCQVTVKERSGGKQPTTPRDTTGVSSLLITDAHIRYLRGHADGTFGADSDMTRAEAAQMFFNLLRNKDAAVTARFTDVDESAWYAQAVGTLASLGVIEGVGGGRFAPERSITRAEFAALAMRFAKQPAAGKNVFSDVSEDAWYYAPVVGAVAYGWIGGYPDGTFGPERTITRAEAVAIVNRMLDRSGDARYIRDHADELVSFSDLSNAHWAYRDIMEAANAHEYTKANNTEHWK